ncbi:HemK family protein methyltransferase [Pelagibacteraceae bacterium]|nr:HemK family protein methyltransferase [Pelagibacteraceae bacterium]
MNDIIKKSLDKLKEKKIPNPELDLRILFTYAAKYKKNIFLNNLNINDINISKFNSFVSKRLNYQPVSKIINKKSFWKSDFFVNFNVLDPRPETELIIEETLNNYKNKNQKLKILDIGTGSGCLAISLAKEFPNSTVTAIDISKKALIVAKKILS